MTIFAKVILLFFCLCGQSHAGEKLRICAPNYEPYTGERLASYGPVVYLTAMAFRHAGYEVDVRIMPWARCLLAGQNGECDVICGVWFNKGREDWMALTDGVLDNELGLFKRRGDDLVFESWNGVKEQNATVGIVRGYINPAELEAAGVATELVRDDQQNMRLLLGGRVRLIAMDKVLGFYLLRHEGRERDVQWLCTLQINTLRNGIMKTSGGDWRRRTADFNRALEALRKSGVVEQVLREYHLLPE